MSLDGVDLCSLPAAPPPAGDISNLINPFTLEPLIIGISTFLLAWSVPFVSIRIWVNRKKLSLADYFIIICAIWNIAFTAIILAQSRYARHQWDVPACWLDGRYMKLIFLVSLLFGFISFGRAAILLMYRQIFSSIVSRTTHVAIWIGLVFNFLIYFPSIPMAVYKETPRPGQSWDDLIYTIPTQEHILVPYGIATGVAALVMDVYIFILPLPAVLRLRLDRTKKIQAVAIFSTAFLAVSASVIALVWRIALGANLKNDSTWATACLFTSMIVENNIVLIVASMPAFASFFRHHIMPSAAYKCLLQALSPLPGSRSKGFKSGPGSGNRHHHFKHLEYRPSDSNVSSYEQQNGKEEDPQPAIPMPVLRPIGIGMTGPNRKMKQHQSSAACFNSHPEFDGDSIYHGTPSWTTTRICSDRSLAPPELADQSQMEKGHRAGFIAKTTSVVLRSESGHI